MTVTRRITSILSVAAMAIAFTVPAHAREVSGIVKAVDPVAGIVYFTDGRMVHLDQSAKIQVNGKQLSLREIRTGDQVEIRDSARSTGSSQSSTQAAQQSESRSPVIALTEHPPVDAIGTIASVDQQNGTITLRDGRTLKLTDQTTFWQRAQTDMLREGAQVFIDDAKPVAFRDQGKPEMKADGSMRMGTVASVDGAGKVITLSDGTRIRMSPAAVIKLNGRPVAVTELTPGSEVVIRVRPTQADAQPSASPATTGSASMSRSENRATARAQSSATTSVGQGGFAEFEGDEVVVVRKHQAP